MLYQDELKADCEKQIVEQACILARKLDILFTEQERSGASLSLDVEEDTTTLVKAVKFYDLVLESMKIK